MCSFCQQTILFTEDEDILELISKNDEVYVAAEDWFSSSLDEDANPPTRPRTTDISEVWTLFH